MNFEYYGLQIDKNNLFSFTKDISTRKFLQSAHQAVTNCKMWDWIRTTHIKSFMYGEEPEMDKIRKEMEKDPINGNHSGASYGWTMRSIEYVAKHGYSKYEDDYSK